MNMPATGDEFGLGLEILGELFGVFTFDETVVFAGEDEDLLSRRKIRYAITSGESSSMEDF